jgi:hypothetical protein
MMMMMMMMMVMMMMMWPDPVNVTRTLLQAVTTPPQCLREQYIIGMDARFFYLALRMLPRRLVNYLARTRSPYASMTPAAVMAAIRGTSHEVSEGGDDRECVGG